MNKEKSKQEDEALVQAAQTGDDRAFEKLVIKYQRQVVNIAMLMVGDREAAEDLAQEVFIKVYNKLSLYTPETSFFSWLYRMTVNSCIDEIRRRKAHKYLSLNFLTEDTGEHESSEPTYKLPSTEIQDDEIKEIMRKALQMISNEHREVLILREYENYGYNEIAEALNISVQAVKSRIFRARAELRSVILKYYKDVL